MLTDALHYATQGWHIFPLQTGGKAPMVAGGFKQATVDAAQITAWWTANPTANIGISLDDSGLCVVDVDTHGDVNGFESLPLLGDLPDTAVARTPSGGAHYVFKNDGTPPPRKISLVRGIDLLSNGYIVAAPSVIDGKPYSWESQAVVSLPQSVRDMAAPKVHTVPSGIAPRSPATKDRDHTMHRASLWLERCDAAYQGQGGHGRLLWAAQGLVNGFMLSRSDTLGLLWSEYNPRCVPAWNQGETADVRDFERKVDQAEASPVKQRGWLLQEEEPFVAPAWMDAFIAGMANRIEPTKATAAEAIPASAEVIAELDEAWGNVEVLEEPSWKPSGLVGDIMQYILDTAQIPQPKYAIAASLAVVGTLVGQKVKSGWKHGRSNLYCMAVGGTSTGKDHPISMVERILEQSGAGDLIGGTDVTSDSAIEKRLSNHPVTLYPWDEAGHTLGGFGSMVDSHRATVVPTLMKLWSSGNKTYRGKDRAGRDNDSFSVRHPCLTIYGTGSTDKIASSLRKDQLKDGWLPRCLYFISTDLGKLTETDDTGHSIPAKILSKCKGFVDFVNPAALEVSVFSEQAVEQDWTITVPIEPAALEALKAFFNEARKIQQTGEETSELWGKAAEQADRIALVVACGMVHDLRDAKVTLANVSWAIGVVRYCIRSFSELISDKVVENDFERNLKMVLEKIKRAGRHGITKHALTRATRSIKGFERLDILKTLKEGQDIVEDIKESATRPMTVYIYKPT